LGGLWEVVVAIIIEGDAKEVWVLTLNHGVEKGKVQGHRFAALAQL
jgi:hypothetical protein